MVTTAVGAGRSQAFDVIVRADGTIVAGGVASADASRPRLVRARRLQAQRHARPARSARAAGVITRVGDGLRRDLRPRAGLRRPLHRGRAGPGRRARPLRARALRPRAASPTRASTPSGRVVVPTSAPYAYAAGGALLPDGRVVAVGASGQYSAVENLRFSGAAVGFSGDATRAVAAPGRRVLLVRQRRRRAARRARAVGGRRRPSGTATPAWRSCAPARTGVPDRTWDGDGIALVARPRRHGGDRRRARRRAAARSPPAHASVGAEHAFMLARFDGAGALDRSFGGQGVVLTELPRHGDAPAPPRSPARPTASSSSPASPARSGSGPQCGGGTARLALARYLGGDAAARRPARRRRHRQPPAAQRAVRLAARRA